MSMDYQGVIGYGIILGYEDDDFSHLPETNTIGVESFGAADHGQSGEMLVIKNSCAEAWEIVRKIDPSHFQVQKWWDIELEQYCNNNNIKFETPKWLLTWLWT